MSSPPSIKCSPLDGKWSPTARTLNSTWKPGTGIPPVRGAIPPEGKRLLYRQHRTRRAHSPLLRIPASAPRRHTRRWTDSDGFSRLDDGDLNTYWKSNPYLTQKYTGEDDALHPQWVFLDFQTNQDVDAIRIAWAEPYATNYVVQYWTGEDPIKKPTIGVWQSFPKGVVTNGKGGTAVLKLADMPISVRWLRVLMTHSSGTCDTHGPSDPRNCLGYAIRELYVGTQTADGKFHDLMRHIPEQDQTPTYCSSVDPWHDASDLDEHAGDQVGFDLFYTGGYTRGLPAMIPIAMIYATPEDSAAEIAYIEKRGYPIAYVEMGEEPDGHYTPPEDYAALYIQWAAALHKVDPKLKLGGPIFTGQNKDIEVWGDQQGKTSGPAALSIILKRTASSTNSLSSRSNTIRSSHAKCSGAAFTTKPRSSPTSRRSGGRTAFRKTFRCSLPNRISRGILPRPSCDTFGALWLADYVRAFLSNGGAGVSYFHYLPLGVGRGCNGSLGTFGMFSADRDLKIQQDLSQFFASQLINLEWIQPGNKPHKLFLSRSDVEYTAGHNLVTSYAALRPDGQWALMIVNKDQENSHAVKFSSTTVPTLRIFLRLRQRDYFRQRAVSVASRRRIRRQSRSRRPRRTLDHRRLRRSKRNTPCPKRPSLFFAEIFRSERSSGRPPR